MTPYDSWLITDPMEDYQNRLRRREADAEPFYILAEPCEACGRPSDDCQCSVPEEPVCPALLEPILAARNVREIQEVCEAHRASCELCNPKVLKMEPATEQTAPEPRKKAA